LLITKTGGSEMKLNAKSLALTCGILWGIVVFIATIWLLIIGASGKTISLLSAFYFGYQFSIGGAFIGLVWGFVDGAIGGLIFAFVYNFFLPKES
jgi:hypothetical protein